MKSKTSNKKRIALITCVCAVILIVAVVLILVLSGGHRVIKVNNATGDVSLERNSKAQEMTVGMNLQSKDVITTGLDGIVELLLDADKIVLAQPDTCFSVLATGNENRGKLKIKLEYGSTLMRIENKLPEGATFEVETPNAVLSVRGTMFTTNYNRQDDVTVIITSEGVVEVTADDDVQQVPAGKMAVIKDDVITVEDFSFAYTEQTLFEVTRPTDLQGSGLYVKELVGWTHEILDVNGTRVDEMVKEDIRIRYWVQSEEEVLEDMEWLKDTEFFISESTMVNADGENIRWGIAGQNNVPFTYRYYKEISPGYYLRLYVYKENGEVFSVDDTIEKYLILTQDCYYSYEGTE